MELRQLLVFWHLSLKYDCEEALRLLAHIRLGLWRVCFRPGQNHKKKAQNTQTIRPAAINQTLLLLLLLSLPWLLFSADASFISFPLFPLRSQVPPPTIHFTVAPRSKMTLEALEEKAIYSLR